MADNAARLIEAFHLRVDDMPHDLRSALEQLSEPRIEEMAQRAVDAALAPLVWRAAVGESWDVRHAAGFLEISRQALYKRVRSGSALGVPGRGTTWFPTWQFDPREHVVRAVVGEIVRAFRDADPDIESQIVAAWATKPNRHLGERSPAQWIDENQPSEPVLLAAQRAAARLAA